MDQHLQDGFRAGDEAYVSPLHTLHLQSRVTVMQSERGERGIRFDVEDL